MNKQQLLFVTYQDENLDEGISYAIELAKAMIEDIVVLLVRKKDGLKEKFDDLMTGVAFAEADEHETARTLAGGAGRSVPAGLDGKITEMVVASSKAGVHLEVQNTEKEVVAGIRSYLKGNATIDKVVLKLVQSFLTPDQISKLTAVMDAMKALEADDRRFVIFERNAKNQSDGNFQINSVGTSAGGTLSMKFNAYTFDTNTNVTSILWFSFSGNSTKLQVSQSTFVLNEQVYARIRDAVVTKLGNRSIDFIGGLQLSEN